MSNWRNTWKDAVDGLPEGFVFMFGGHIYRMINGKPEVDTKTQSNDKMPEVVVMRTIMQDENGELVVSGVRHKCLTSEYKLQVK